MGAADADHPRGVLRERPRLALTARFASQLLAERRAGSAGAVVERLLAVQAQDPRGFRLAVRARSSGVSVADVEAALGSRELVVSWLNRGTLHLVRAEDYWWLHALTTPPLLTGNARRLAQEGVDAAAAERGVAAVVHALSSSGPATRAALREAVAAADVRVEGQALVHVLFLAALRGLVVRGPVVGSGQAYVLAPDWLGPPPRSVDRDAALGELARRYLRGHAPADDRDLARWAGLPLRDVRRGLALAGPGPGPAPSGRGGGAAPRPVLLGAFDPLLLGWASRAWLVGEHERRLVNGGLFRPFAVVDGRAVAAWRLVDGQVVLEPFAEFDEAVLAGEARDVERFLART